jgi:hypothetical protein
MLLAMPGDDVDKFLEDAKSFEGRKQALIDDLLRQKAAAMAGFDDKLAKLGYKDDGARPRKSHHKKAAAPAVGKSAAAEKSTSEKSKT